jgi:hypothetical protein
MVLACACTAAAWGAAATLLFVVHRIYRPDANEATPFKSHASPRRSTLTAAEHNGVTGALIIRDARLLARRQRSTIYLLLFAIVVTAIPSIAQEKAEEIYASTIALQIVFGWLLVNSLLILFEYDAEKSALLKWLPLKAATLWRSRWCMAATSLALPALIPAVITPSKHPPGFGFLLFIFFALLLAPAVFATIYCNAGFGMFPQVKYSGIILNITLALMLLFWFFMPFGTPMLLAVMLFWVRKSQKHFQVLEIA